MSFLFENLIVYLKAMVFAKEVLRLFDHRGKTSGLCDQFRRAAMSIPVNIAEGCGRWHLKDRQQFFWVARGSVNECVTWLDLAVAQGLIERTSADEMKQELDFIGRMITGLISSGERRAVSK